MEPFRPFTSTHYITLLVLAVIIAMVVATGKRTLKRKPLEHTLAWLNIAVWVTAHGWWQIPPRFDPALTLPLQMCHITSLIASAVLLTGNRTLRAVLYFWAFALCTQAVITPGLIDPPSSLIFWGFWFLHGFVMMTAVYDLAVKGFRPHWRDYGIACTASITYVALTLPLNLLLGANYGFTGKSKPLNSSIVDLLGAWPDRLILIVLLAATAMWLALLPWLLFSRQRRSYAR